MEEKKISGYITREVDEALDDYAKSKNKKKMGLIGEIITNFIKGENDDSEEKTGTKKAERKKT
jgi:hypothetical protein